MVRMSPTPLLRALVHLWLALARRPRAAGAQRGDVPGWVLVTVMTAGLVTAIWLVAGPRLTGMLEAALDGVTAP